MSNLKISQFIVILLCITSIACTKDDFLVAKLDSSKKAFNPEIIKSNCYIEGTSYELIQPEDESYQATWIHDGNPIGHEMNTSCLCGGTVEVKITRAHDSTQMWKSFNTPDCNEEVK